MKKIPAVLCSLLALLMLAACADTAARPTPPPMTVEPFTSREEVVELYDQVFIGEKRADLEARMGSEGERVATHAGETTQWLNGNTGVCVVFWPDDTVRAKTLYFEDTRQFCPLTGPVDLSIVNFMTLDMDAASALMMIGGQSAPGIELACAQIENSAGVISETRMMIWVNTDGTMLQMDISTADRVSEIRTYLYGAEDEELE